MTHPKPFKLKLTKLDFLSSCDVPAQGQGGAALLLKRATDEFTLKAKVSKLSDDLGLVFGYAFATSLDGGKTAHVDSQNDIIDADFLKTVTEFLEAGGATDVNHDFARDGKIVYAWPLLPEINKAMGIESDVIGLAVAVKPSAETYAKFKSGELTGFSIAGTGIREPLEKAGKRVTKSTLYTDEQLGHQHTISICDDGSLWVSYATSEGAEDQHTHGAVFEDGAITILADSGHTHSLAEGQPGVAVVPADAIVVVQQSAHSGQSPTRNRAAAQVASNKSTQTPAVPHGGHSSTEKPKMNIAKLLASFLAMSAAQRAHVSKMAPDEIEGFFGKTSDEREAIAKAALDADPIEVEFNGQTYRKSAGPAVIELAKAAKAQAETVAKQAEAIEKAEVRKLAAEVLNGMPGEDATHDAIIGALRKNLTGDALDKALATLKGMRATSNIGKPAPGVGGADPQTVELPSDALQKRVEKFQADNKITTYEKAFERCLQVDPEAQRLYAAAR